MERQWEVRSGVKLGLPNFNRGRGWEEEEGKRRRRTREEHMEEKAKEDEK